MDGQDLAHFEESSKQLVARYDAYKPDEYRAFTVRNLDAWHAASNIQPGETLYLAPKGRVNGW